MISLIINLSGCYWTKISDTTAGSRDFKLCVTSRETERREREREREREIDRLREREKKKR